MENEIEIPESIKIGGFDYLILIGDKTNKELQSTRQWGTHSGCLQEIKISTDGSEQQISDTFIHEILHGINIVYNNDDASEACINSLSHGLLQVFESLGLRFVTKCRR